MSLWSLIGLDDDNTAAGDAAAGQLSSMAASDYAPGGSIYTQIASTQGTAAADAAYAQTKMDFANQDSTSPWTILSAGLAGSVEAVTDPAQWKKDVSAGGSILGGGIGDIVSSILNGIKNIFTSLFSQIPWWVWLLAALALFWWLGGGKYLENKARKALS